MAKRGERAAGNRPVCLRATDFTKYLGKGSAPRPYTEEQLSVMVAGSAAVYLAIMERTPARMRACLDHWEAVNAERFPRRPLSNFQLLRRRRILP